MAAYAYRNWWAHIGSVAFRIMTCLLQTCSLEEPKGSIITSTTSIKHLPPKPTTTKLLSLRSSKVASPLNFALQTYMRLPNELNLYYVLYSSHKFNFKTEFSGNLVARVQLIKKMFNPTLDKSFGELFKILLWYIYC